MPLLPFFPPPETVADFSVVDKVPRGPRHHYNWRYVPNLALEEKMARRKKAKTARSKLRKDSVGAKSEERFRHSVPNDVGKDGWQEGELF